MRPVDGGCSLEPLNEQEAAEPAGELGPDNEMASELQLASESSSAIKARRAPALPTARELEEHEISHEPYRSWFAACVAGRGRAEYHWLGVRSIAGC